MNNTELKAFKKKILIEIQKTEKKIKQYTELCKPIAPENAIGRVSRMDAINNKSITEEALRIAKEKIYQLKRMQERSGNIGFGKCEKCQKTIATGRLMIRPQSKFCVICAH